MAHIGGTSVEILTPLVLLFTTNAQVALAAALLMVAFHAFIISTFPLAVPLEWNVAYGFIAMILFVGLPERRRLPHQRLLQPVLLVAIVGGLVFFPVLGNMRPDLVSFLPSMRQYAGNWASATWAFAPGKEERLEELNRPASLQIPQLMESMKVERNAAEMTMQTTLGWRSMHSQGRGLFSVMIGALGDDIDRWTIREAEFAANVILGWNFGDGHIHDERLIAAIQRRLQFAPGEFMVAFVESQPVTRPTQEYRLIDAALGVVERGTWTVSEAVAEQPWLPNGPIALDVTWRHPEYAPAPRASRSRLRDRRGRGRQRAQRARCRPHPGRRRCLSADHRGSRDPGWRGPVERADPSRPGPRRVLGVPPPRGGVALHPAVRPGRGGVDLEVGARRVRAPAAGRTRRRGDPLGGGDRTRSR